jgi:hypothetical protein
VFVRPVCAADLTWRAGHTLLRAVLTTLVSGYTDHNVRDVMFDTVIVKMSHVVTEVSDPTR